MPQLKRLLQTKAATRLVPEAAPFRISPEGAKEAFLLCHGFTGIPRELSKVGAALADKGIASYAPRYPGHGTDRDDFYATGAADWLRRAIDAYLELKAEYATVHVLGHSMGGLIAAIVAATFNAPRLVLLAPAFKVNNSFLPLSPAIRLVAPVVKRRRRNEESDPVRKELFDDYWSDDLVAQAYQLRRLQKAACRELPRVHSRILLVAGEKDDTVPASVIKYVEKNALGAASFEARTIAGGGHLFPFDQGSLEACAEIQAWLEKA